MTETNVFKDLTENYLSLGRSGKIGVIAGGDDFWSLAPEEIERFGDDWFVSEYVFDADWQTWEMHPNGEEIVYLLSGAINLILEKDGSQKTLELRSKGLVVVPRGTWHTAKVFEPSRVLVMTLGKDTQIRPAN